MTPLPFIEYTKIHCLEVFCALFPLPETFPYVAQSGTSLRLLNIFNSCDLGTGFALVSVQGINEKTFLKKGSRSMLKKWFALILLNAIATWVMIPSVAAEELKTTHGQIASNFIQSGKINPYYLSGAISQSPFIFLYAGTEAGTQD